MKFPIRGLAALILFACSMAALAVPLEGGWRPAQPNEDGSRITRDDATLQVFDPAQLLSVGAGPHGNWVLLWPRDGAWPTPPWVLRVKSPGMQTISLLPSARIEPVRRHLMMKPADEWPGHGAIVFAIDHDLPAGEPLRLHVDAVGVIPAAMSFSAVPAPEYLRTDSKWLAATSACLSIMVAMALMALFFAQRMRDVTFVHYALFVISYATILSVQTGFAADPLGWRFIADAPRLWGRLATAGSVVFSILFVDHFADLPRYAPRGRRALIFVAGLAVLLSVLHLVPIEAIARIGRFAINPVLIIGAPLLLGVCVVAAWRGSRYSRFFLLGWTPLLFVTVIDSLQLYGFARSWTWASDAAIGAGAIEAIVLSLALADRSLALREDRDRARQLADLDALTGLLNRRAWSDRLQSLDEYTRTHRQALSILFLDLDHFKELNDRHGHEAGDDALQRFARIMSEELRQHDAVGRYGGEEFVIALPGSDNWHAANVAERIRRRLHDLVAADGEGRMRTVSVGVVTRRAGEAMGDLMRRADEAMYAAKAAGRDRVVSIE